MRAPLSWLREAVELPDGVAARDLGDALVPMGMELDSAEEYGTDVTGPLVVGRVASFEELTGFKKPIRYAQVDVGEDAPRGIVCGATNFAAGDLVVVALPGAELPGGFAIASRRTYGHVSDGMICSVRELGIGDDHAGILVLAPDSAVPGTDAYALLGLRDGVVHLEIPANNGYLESIRGVAREVANVRDAAYTDPAGAVPPVEADGTGYACRIEDVSGCDRYTALSVTGIDPTVPAPLWMRTRLHRAGVRSISLAVDVTNYVMLELGQPLHAFDQGTLVGDLVVRRAYPDEPVVTLDHVRRTLDPDDMVVADDEGPVTIGGVMGDLRSEVSATTRDVLFEAAHWDPPSIGRTVRRHKLPSEAARRFQRGVDPEVALPALRRAAQLLVEHAGGTVGAVTAVGFPYEAVGIDLPADLPARTIGLPVDPATVVAHLERVGCTVERPAAEQSRTDRPLLVWPPSWRPDLRDPADLVEEVARLVGYATIPAALPPAPGGRGLTAGQRLRRRVGRALAYAGYVEAVSPPFVAAADWDALGLTADDPRRAALRLVNPLSEEQPLLRTTLLPGLFAALRRNVGRGIVDVALFESGKVYEPRPEAPVRAPLLRVDARPGRHDLDQVDAVLPGQPEHVALVAAGEFERTGWWSRGRAVTWTDAVEAARAVLAEAGRAVEVRAGDRAPWHPGRCAELVVGKEVVGYAGELHPRVVAACDLPPRTVAAELDLSALHVEDVAPVRAPAVSGYPPVFRDVALVVDATVPVVDVETALREGAGELLEAVRLFDVYEGAQVGAGRKSLAYALRLRAADRTLTAEEANAARDAATAEAGRRTGATLRG